MKSSESLVFGRGSASEKQAESNFVDENRYNNKSDDSKVGRPNCMDVEKREKLLEAYYSRPYSLRQLAVMFGVSRMTVWRVVQEFGQVPNFVL
ncbi:MAG: hypothetical protein AABW86_01620 [Candidatus Micrarchaeota archaeon]